MKIERLRELANRFEAVGVGGFFTRAEQQELCRLTLEAAALLEQVAPSVATPAWDNAPEWANWVAMDKSGGWFWYENKPEQFNREGWISNGRGRKALAKMAGDGWYASLQQHPHTEEHSMDDKEHIALLQKKVGEQAIEAILKDWRIASLKNALQLIHQKTKDHRLIALTPELADAVECLMYYADGYAAEYTNCRAAVNYASEQVRAMLADTPPAAERDKQDDRAAQDADEGEPTATDG